jgi:hypothetical protein
MKSKRKVGPSLYFATDKNIFDALNQHKVDSNTISKLFLKRNIIVGKKTKREDLAKYFARLNHDLYDHKEISAKLGIATRREKMTSMDVIGISDDGSLTTAVTSLKQELESSGDVVHVTRDGDNVIINVQYSTVDYTKSEFSQVQVRDGTIEFLKSEEGYIVRNTQNEHMNDVLDSLIGKVEASSASPLQKSVVSLFDIVSSKLRSKFFYDLVHYLPNYKLIDVTDVYIYKAKPESYEEDEDQEDIDPETHVERVFLRGSGVTRSELLNDLLEKEDYYITKIGWTAKEIMGLGRLFDIEAVFTDPKNCTGFSFILSGVFPVEDGALSSRRRTPHKDEIEIISQAIEKKSRELVIQFAAESLRADDGEEEGQ